MTKARNRLLIGLVVVTVLAGVARESYQFLDRRAVAREAVEAKTTAMASAATVIGPEDARRWLESNGYHVTVWNPHDSRGFVGIEEGGANGKHVIVQGQRQIRAGNWIIKPMWLDVTFRFTLDGAFHDVQASPSPIQFPA